MISNKELLEEAVKKAILDSEDNYRKREEFIHENYQEWRNEGIKYRHKREELGLSLRKVGELLGTSSTRIRNFEVGEPVSQVKQLKASYDLLFDYINLQSFVLEFKANVSRSTDVLFDNMLTIYKNSIK